MSTINRNTRVHVIWIRDNCRWYLSRMETARNSKGNLYLKGYWGDDPACSAPWAYETATMIRARLNSENGLKTHIAFNAGNTVELIDEEN
jgi:hypothetical protein